MTPDQAPNACPFCWAARKPACAFAWFRCGTMNAPADNNRRDQTPTCATAERDRLTRERDEARAERDALKADIAIAAGELRVPIPAPGTDMARSMSANVILRHRNADLLARVKRLEEAGNELLWALCPASTSMMTERESDALKLWNEAKEAKP